MPDPNYNKLPDLNDKDRPNSKQTLKPKTNQILTRPIISQLQRKRARAYPKTNNLQRIVTKMSVRRSSKVSRISRKWRINRLIIQIWIVIINKSTNKMNRQDNNHLHRQGNLQVPDRDNCNNQTKKYQNDKKPPAISPLVNNQTTNPIRSRISTKKSRL